MREYILVNEADADGGRLLKCKTDKYLIKTKDIENVSECEIEIMDPLKICPEIKSKYNITAHTFMINGSVIFGSKESGFGRSLIVIESVEEIEKKMFADEK